jgi:hypothetical protein
MAETTADALHRRVLGLATGDIPAETVQNLTQAQLDQMHNTDAITHLDRILPAMYPIHREYEAPLSLDRAQHEVTAAGTLPVATCMAWSRIIIVAWTVRDRARITDAIRRYVRLWQKSAFLPQTPTYHDITLIEYSWVSIPVLPVPFSVCIVHPMTIAIAHVEQDMLGRSSVMRAQWTSTVRPRLQGSPRSACDSGRWTQPIRDMYATYSTAHIPARLDEILSYEPVYATENAQGAYTG